MADGLVQAPDGISQSQSTNAATDSLCDKGQKQPCQSLQPPEAQSTISTSGAQDSKAVAEREPGREPAGEEQISSRQANEQAGKEPSR